MTNEAVSAGKTHSEGLSTSAGSNNQLAGFGYDAAGNMVSNGSISYVYDAENRLIATAGYSYLYDGDGQRVEKCTEGTTPGTCATGATGFLYWRGNAESDALKETDLAGNVQNNYIFFDGAAAGTQRQCRSSPLLFLRSLGFARRGGERYRKCLRAGHRLLPLRRGGERLLPNCCSELQVHRQRTGHGVRAR